MNKLISFCLLLLIPVLSFGQSKKVWLENADDYFAEAKYPSALKYYQLVLNDSLTSDVDIQPYQIVITNLKLKAKDITIDSTKTIPIRDYIDHQIAVCLEKTFDYSHAVEQLKKTSESTSYPEDLYFLGDAYMKIRDYKTALRTLDAYTKSPEKVDSLVSRAVQQMIACNYALDENNFKREVGISKADTAVFNKGTSSFAAMYFDGDKVLFTSAREGGIVIDPEKQQSAYLCDLYWTEKENDTTWGLSHNFGRPLNSAQHDASGSFNKNNVIFYNRWNDEKPTEQAIYLARMIDFRFFEAYKLGTEVNYPNSRNINPFVSEDGTTLYFSSDRPGGKGGLDLWKIKIDELGNIMDSAINLGYPINTEFDEVTPFFHAKTSTLFFSSTGHNSIGGLDIYKSHFDIENLSYEIPENLGLPINSSKDDAYLVWDEDLKTGFFSSDREPCETGHCYDIYTVTNEPIRITLDGYAYNKQTQEILANTKLTFKDVRGNFPEFVLETNSEGYYSLELQQQWELFIKAQKKDYFADATNIDIRYITETTALTHDFYLDPIPQDEIQIDGIEYDFNSAKLRPASKEVLDKLYDFIALNNNLVIEINSHTDSRGSDKYNQKLSQQRAQSCVDYLVEKGIEKERLIAIGYGESSPNYLLDENKKHVVNENGEEVKLTEDYINGKLTKDEQEELHQRNRRTSFKVVKQDQ